MNQLTGLLSSGWTVPTRAASGASTSLSHDGAALADPLPRRARRRRPGQAGHRPLARTIATQVGLLGT